MLLAKENRERSPFRNVRGSIFRSFLLCPALEGSADRPTKRTPNGELKMGRLTLTAPRRVMRVGVVPSEK